MMRKYHVLPTGITRVEADESEFDAPTEDMTTMMPLLYQSGYLTIKDYNRDYNYYTLDIPNKEVKIGLTKALIPSYVTGNTLATTNTARRIAQALDKQDMDGALHLLQDFWVQCLIAMSPIMRGIISRCFHHLLAPHRLSSRCRGAYSKGKGRCRFVDWNRFIHHRTET